MVTERDRFQDAEIEIRHFIQNELMPKSVAADGLELAGLEAILMEFINFAQGAMICSISLIVASPTPNSD